MLPPTRPVAPTTATFHRLLIIRSDAADTRFPLGEHYLKPRAQIRYVAAQNGREIGP